MYSTRAVRPLRRAATTDLLLALLALAAGVGALFFAVNPAPVSPVIPFFLCVVIGALALMAGAYRGLLTRSGVLLVALALLLPAAANAQTLVVDVDKGTVVGLGPESLWPAELDGDLTTREWIQYRVLPTDEWQLRGVALRGGGVCTGDWFNPWFFITLRGWDFFAAGAVMRSGGGIDRFVAQGQQTYAEVAIGYGCGR